MHRYDYGTMAKKPRYLKTTLDLTDGKVAIYVGQKVHNALREVTSELDIYQGVRLGEVLQAAYDQGKKDGRKEMIEKLDSIKKETNYLPPGRPKKMRTLKG